MHDMDGADKDELGKRIVGEVGYHATLSRWSSRVRVPYSPQDEKESKVILRSVRIFRR